MRWIPFWIGLILATAACRTADTGGDSQTASLPPGGEPSDPAGDNTQAPDDAPAQGDQGGQGGQCGGDFPDCPGEQICVRKKGLDTGKCYEDPHRAHRPENVSMLQKLTVKPASGGFNPQYKGVTVTADVLVGGNPCLAKGRKAEFKVVDVTVDNYRVKHIWPASRKTGQTNANCTRDFRPQFKKVSQTFPNLLEQRDRIIVHGIRDVEGVPAKLVFGSACPIPMCAQPPVGCHMARPEPMLLNQTGCPMLSCGMMVCENAGCPPGSRQVDIGRDPVTACPRKPVCVDDSTCPQVMPLPPGWCSNGTIVQRGYDERGCFRSPVCRTMNTPCPQLMPPPPGWCSDGTIAPGGVDDRGCTRAPRCIRPGDCPEL